MHRKFMFTLLLVVLLALSVGNVVFAQDAPECFNLPAADCEVITAAQIKMDEVSSSSYDLEINLSVEGLEILAAFMPGIPGAMSMTLLSNGAFDEGAQALQVFYDLSMDMGEPMQTTGQFAFIDSFVYIVAEGMSMGLEINEEDMADLFPVDPTDPGSVTDSFDAGTLTSMLAEFGIDAEAYVNYARLGDVDGMAPFELTFDIAGLLNSPEFGALVGALAGESMEGMDQMLPMLFGGLESSIVMTEYVKDGYVYLTDFAFTFSLDLAPLMGSPDPMVMNIVLDGTFSVDDLNAVPAIVAPEVDEMYTGEEAEAKLEEIFGKLEEMLGGLGL